MALRFIDGFETYGSIGTDIKDIAEGMSGRWTGIQESFPNDLSLQAGAHGGISLRMNQGSNYIAKSLDAQQTWIIGFWVKWDSFYNANNSFLIIYDDETYMCRL